MPDLARFGMDADRGRSAACENLSQSVLKNPPEKVHGKPGHAIPLPPSRKKIPPVRSLPNTRAESKQSGH